MKLSKKHVQPGGLNTQKQLRPVLKTSLDKKGFDKTFILQRCMFTKNKIVYRWNIRLKSNKFQISQLCLLLSGKALKDTKSRNLVVKSFFCPLYLNI